MPIKNHEVVLEFLDHEDYRKNLRYHAIYKVFIYYSDGCYEIWDDEKIRSTLFYFISARYKDKNFTFGALKDYTDLLKLVATQVTVESYIYIAFKDCLLNTETFTPEPFGRDKISLHRIPFFFDQINDRPTRFLQFLRSSIVLKHQTTKPDQELIKLVQEMMGYFLIGNMKGATAWFLIGGGANGKSVLAETIKAMVGSQFTANMTIESLTTNKFKTQNLVGKRLNVAAEEESKFISSSLFKNLVTGESVDAERKFGESFSFTPTTKYIFCTNAMPTFSTYDGGLLRRIKIIPFFRQFAPSERDISLSWPNSSLKDELAGIVGWALEGAVRLTENNFVYSYSRASEDARNVFEEEISSALRFVRENYMTDDSTVMPYDDLYLDYVNWCRFNGKKSLNKFNFLRDIETGIAGIIRVRKTVDYKTFRGLNLVKTDEYFKGNEKDIS